jgi:hypothetical protein
MTTATRTLEVSRPAFNKRAFIALLAVCSFLTLPFSGLALHLVDHHGTAVGLSAHRWMVIHWSFSIVFAVCTVWHCVYNRRQLANAVRRTVGRRTQWNRELLATAIVLVVTITTIVAHPS